MLVVDTSAVVDVLVGRDVDPALLHRLSTGGSLHAPHLLDVEFLHALRRLVRTGALALDRAQDARADLDRLRVARYPHQGLADRVWELRDAVTAYDGVFVALSELLGCPLVTADRRLARSAGHAATVEAYPAG